MERANNATKVSLERRPVESAKELERIIQLASYLQRLETRDSIALSHINYDHILPIESAEVLKLEVAMQSLSIPIRVSGIKLEGHCSAVRTKVAVDHR
jgi:hypothetical protein